MYNIPKIHHLEAYKIFIILIFMISKKSHYNIIKLCIVFKIVSFLKHFKSFENKIK